MSEDNNKEQPKQETEDTRIKIKPKDAAASLLPAGMDAQNMTPEQQLNVTSTMVKASRLHEKAIEGLTESEQEVYNALLLATPDDIPVEDRFAKANQLFSATVKKDVDKSKEESEEIKVSPKGEADVNSTVPLNNSNLLDETDPAPYGNDDDYFKFLAERFKKQTTVQRRQN